MREGVRAGILLGVVLLAFFAPVLLGGSLLAPSGDALSYYYPMRVHAAEIALKDGVPLWSPALFGGFPLLADVEVGALYPPSLLFLLLPPVLAMNLLVVFTYWLAGISTFVYCRAIGASPLGALVAALTYMLSGFMVAHLGHLTIIGGAAWLPLLLHQLERLREDPGRRRLAGLSLVVALQALGGHPQVVLGSWLLCAVYAAALVLREPPGGRRRFLLSAAAGAALGALAVAAQWLPTLELLKGSVRATLSYKLFVEFSLPPSHLLSFFFPFLFGAPIASPIAPVWWGRWSETEMSGYVGLSPWLLAPLALGRPRARLWLALGAVFLIVSLGGHTPLAALLYRLPVFSLFRAPARNLLFVDLALAVLVGLGATRLAAEARVAGLRRAAAVLLVGLCAMFGLLATGGAFARRLLGVAPPQPESVFTPANPALALPLVAVGVVLAGWWFTAKKPRAGFAAVAAVLLDLGFVGEQGFWRVAAPSEAGAARLPAVAALSETEREVRRYRVLSLIDEQNAMLPFGIRDAAGSSSLAPARTLALLGGMDSAAYVFDTQRLFEGRSIDLLGVRYVIVPSEFAAPEAIAARQGIAETRERYEIRLSAAPLHAVEFELPAVRSTGISVVAGIGAQGPYPGQAFLRATLWDASGARLERTLLAALPAPAAGRAASVGGSAELDGTFELERLRLTSLVDTPLEILAISCRGASGRTLTLSSQPWLADARLPVSRRHADAVAAGATATSLTLVSALVRAAHIEQGQGVARVTVTDREGRKVEAVLRAGVDTAEWAWDRPDVRFRVRHARAPLAQSTQAGWFYDAHRYRTRVELGERISVERVALEYLAPIAGLDLFELRLEDAATGQSTLLEPDRRRLEPDPPEWTERAALDLPLAPVRAATLELVSALEDSVLQPDGAAVARVRVDTADGETQSHVLRAGADTSEWAWERPDVRARVRHARASVFASFPAESGAFEGHWYLARFDLGGERFVERVRIERVSPSAGLVISGIGLRTVAGRSLPLYQREGPVSFDGKTLPLTLLPGVSLRSLELPVPATAASALVVVSALRHSLALRQGQPVARVSVRCEGAGPQELWLRAGEHTSEWAWADPSVRPRVAHRQAPIAETGASADAWGRDYAARLELAQRCRVNGLTLSYVAPEALLSVTGLSLVDDATGLATPVSVAGARLTEPGRWQRRLKVGGAAVFENRHALPRAWLVSRVRSLPAPDVLRAVRTGDLPDGTPFEPRATALVEEGGDRDFGSPDPDASVEVEEPSARRLLLSVRSRAPAFLVVSDSFDPGWKAQLDGEPARLLRTNFVQRGLPVPAGEHRVAFTYDPRPFRLGAALSGVALAVLVALRPWARDRVRRIVDTTEPGK